MPGPCKTVKRSQSTDDDDILESLINTFPASDPPAWVALARVGIPKRKPTSRRARKPLHI
jgi:hypothetical protein